MSILSLTELFKSIMGFEIYAINFPEYENDTATKIEITSGIEEYGGVMDFNTQFMVRASHPSQAEAISNELIGKIDMKTNTEFGDGGYQLILAKASSPQPFFMGETTEGEFVYSVDFRLLVTEI